MKKSFSLMQPKIISALLAIALFSVAVVGAGLYMPLPINGKVISSTGAGYGITVTNLRTGVTMTTLTDQAGAYLVEWANSDDKAGTILKYQQGDKFKVEIAQCAGAPECVQTLTYSGQPNLYNEFNLNGVSVKCPDPITCPAPVTCPTCPSSTPTSGPAIFAVLAAIAVIFSAYPGYFRFQIKKKVVSSTGKVSYVYATIFQKASTGNKITEPA